MQDKVRQSDILPFENQQFCNDDDATRHSKMRSNTHSL